MCAYRILLNGNPSVLNYAYGDLLDPYANSEVPSAAFSTGRKAQAALKAHKKYCVDHETSLEGCFYTFEKGEFVPNELEWFEDTDLVCDCEECRSHDATYDDPAHCNCPECTKRHQP